LESPLLKRENLYIQLADRLEREIIDDPALIGSRLPSEQSIAYRFQVSRNVVREALKVLKERGFVEVRNGACACVCRPTGDSVRSAVERFVRTDPLRIPEVFEVRYALEVTAAQLAALRRTSEDIEACETYLKAMEDGEADPHLWTESDYRFHRSIIGATKNELYIALYESICPSLKTLFEYAWPNVEARKAGLAMHRRILHALREEDTEEIGILMREHLTMSESGMEYHQ